MKRINILSLVKTFLLAFIVFLIGCVGFRHREIPHGLTPDNVSEYESIIILSTGAKSPRLGQSCALVVRRVENGKFVAAVGLNDPTVKSHFDDHHGFLNILKFKPGKYFFVLQAGRPLAWYGDPSGAFVFEVKEREIVYLGEVFYEYVKFSAYEAWSSEGRGGYVRLTLNDRFERDVRIFLEKNPSFKLEDVTKRPPYLVRLDHKETPPKDNQPEDSH